MRSTLPLCALGFVLATTASAGAAPACDRLHALEYDLSAGVATLTVNDVFYKKIDGKSATMMNFIAWTLDGDNRIDVVYRGDGKATFQLVSGCKGAFETEPASDLADLSGGGSATLSFNQTGGVDDSFAATRPSDDRGLARAYAAFRAAVLARDAATAIAIMEPLIARAAQVGWPRPRFTAHLSRAIETGTFDVPEAAAFTAAAGGRVYQRLTADQDPALIARFKSDSGGTWTVPLGTYWAKVDGAWRIIHN